MKLLLKLVKIVFKKTRIVCKNDSITSVRENVSQSRNFVIKMTNRIRVFTFLSLLKNELLKFDVRTFPNFPVHMT